MLIPSALRSFFSIVLICTLFFLFSCEGNKKKAVVKEKSEKVESLTQVVPIDRSKKKETVIIKKRVIKNSRKIIQFCQKIDRTFKKYGWGESRCKDFKWNHVRNSVKGDPLMWIVFGDEKKKIQADMTMVLCGVHGDEITPIKFCFDIIHHMKKYEKDFSLKNRLLIVAPIASPDSFFKKRPTRTNARGVDINRNFPTKDWKQDALRLWAKKYRKNKRRFPGPYALSEPETLFQVNLMKRYRPDKIISIHAPLTMIDYDGPGPLSNQKVGVHANQLLIKMSEQSGGYRIRNFPFYPGSLGNYAGNERKIPTYTLELPSSDNRKSKEYWKLFKNAIHSALLNDFTIK